MAALLLECGGVDTERALLLLSYHNGWPAGQVVSSSSSDVLGVDGGRVAAPVGPPVSEPSEAAAPGGPIVQLSSRQRLAAALESNIHARRRNTARNRQKQPRSFLPRASPTARAAFWSFFLYHCSSINGGTGCTADTHFILRPSPHPSTMPPRKQKADDHYISIQNEATSKSTPSSLSSPLLSASDPVDSLASSSARPRAGKSVKKSALDQSVLQSLISKKEDRSLYKDEAVKDTVTTGRKDAKVTFGRLLSQAKPERPLIVVATVCLFFAAVLNMMIPAFCGTIIDAISQGESSEQSKQKDWLYQYLLTLGFGDSPKAVLNVSVILLVIIICLASIFTSLRAYFFTLAGERVVARLRIELFTHLSSLEVGFFDVTRTGELINRLSADTTILKDAVTINVSMALRWIASILVGIAYLFLVSWKLTLVMLSVVPLVIAGAMIYGKKIKLLSKATQEALAHATETAEESISHIRTVKSFNREARQAALYSDKIHTTFLLGKRIAWLYGVFVGIISFVAMGAMILVLWYGATLVLSGEMTTGLLTSYVLYTLTVGVALAALSGLFASWMSALGACDRIFELLDRPAGVTDKAAQHSANDFAGKIVFNDVRFSYPARSDVEVLKGISFALHPGTVTALVGPSGQGKSTVVSLIERFYDLVDDGEHGSITVDGQPIQSLPLLHLHRHIGLVSQNPVLFATTIRENLLYGCRPSQQRAGDDDEVAAIDDERLLKACEMANAASFISAFPEGLDTLVGERGVRLSGGQLQRIAIARAILLNPRVLIADEATSSLDAESEYVVQQALDRLMQGRTVLVIAHRLSTVKNADNVIVIEHGRVSESGTHAELLERGGSYSRLVARQLEGDGLSEEEQGAREQRRLAKREQRERGERALEVAVYEDEAKMADDVLPSPSLSADYASQTGTEGGEGEAEEAGTEDSERKEGDGVEPGTSLADHREERLVV